MLVKAKELRSGTKIDDDGTKAAVVTAARVAANVIAVRLDDGRQLRLGVNEHVEVCDAD